MANILDYLDWRGDLSLSLSPFNAVDSLIMSCLAYIRFDGVVPSPGCGSVSLPEAAARFLAQNSEQRIVRSANDETLLEKAALSARFRAARLAAYVSHFEPEAEKQFCALTVLLPDDTACIAFRGTDSTLVGWKEDLNMSFLSVVPAQEESLTYIKTIAQAYPRCLLRTMGHSKGGNLAIFSAARCEALQGRILDVFNNDGPGFLPETVQSPGYREISGRIHAFVPQSSLVGMLLEHPEPYQVIHSTQKGIYQHEPYSWEVLNAHFVSEPEITPSQQQMNQAIRDWIASVPPQQREAFVDELFRLLSAQTTDAKASPPNGAAEWLQVLRTYYAADPSQRSIIQETLNKLAEAARDVILGKHSTPKPVATPAANDKDVLDAPTEELPEEDSRNPVS